MMTIEDRLNNFPGVDIPPMCETTGVSQPLAVGAPVATLGLIAVGFALSIAAGAIGYGAGHVAHQIWH